VNPSSTCRSFFFSLLQYCISRFVARNDHGEPEGDEAMIENIVSIFVRGLHKKEHPDPISAKTLTDGHL
jgi:hypothetical protein